MTSDHVRAFYAAISIELPAWSTREAPVRCFGQPDAHNHADRSPSCSVNLTSGAWNCHGCGARGGAYDAALAAGHTPRSAMELLISHGLAEPRASNCQPPRCTPARFQAAPSRATSPGLDVHSALAANEGDVQLWAKILDADSRLVRRLALERVWSSSAIRDLGIGFDGARITIPVRSARGALRGVLRYDPFGPRDPKMLAVPGTRLGLVPHPACEPSDRILLVEGPPDMIAARSCGLHAIAVPGTNAWRSSWAQLLAGKHVTIVMDCDVAGRRAADEIATSLRPAATAVEMLDLWPDRNDGYDLTNRIAERRRVNALSPRASHPMRSLLSPYPSRSSHESGRRSQTF